MKEYGLHCTSFQMIALYDTASNSLDWKNLLLFDT